MIDFTEYQREAHKTAVYDRLFTETQVYQMVGWVAGELPEFDEIDVPRLAEVFSKAMEEIGDTQIAYAALGLGGEAGEVLEKIKKLVRDDEGFMTPERQDALKKELGDILWYLAEVATQARLDLNDVAQANLDKLRSRQERGVLQGSGDDR